MNGGPVAEWSCRGLQILARRFDSGPGLQRRRGVASPGARWYRPPRCSGVAQSVEQAAVNRWVVGSSPTAGANRSRLSPPDRDPAALDLVDLVPVADHGRLLLAVAHRLGQLGQEAAQAVEKGGVGGQRGLELLAEGGGLLGRLGSQVGQRLLGVPSQPLAQPADQPLALLDRLLADGLGGLSSAGDEVAGEGGGGRGGGSGGGQLGDYGVSPSDVSPSRRWKVSMIGARSAMSGSCPRA